MSALQHLTTLEWEHKRRQHPTIEDAYLLKPTFSDGTHTELTYAIIRCFELHGYCVLRGYHTPRIGNTGSWRTCQPNVLAVVEGHTVLVDIRVGCAKLSDADRRSHQQLVSAGASVYVARTFQGFYSWFEAYIMTIPKSTSSPYNSRHPIPRLATPDLPAMYLTPRPTHEE